VESWEVRGKGAGGEPIVLLTETARGREVVEVPAGRFDTLVVETARSPSEQIKFSTRAYFAEGVGVVKEERRDGVGPWEPIRTLKSFHAGKDRTP
jgi:hypothetical protein